MLEEQILSALTEEQKRTIAALPSVTTFPQPGNREKDLPEEHRRLISDYELALAASLKEAEISPYTHLRACVAVEWARTFRRYFEGETSIDQLNSALKMRLAYDLLHPESLPQNLFDSFFERMCTNDGFNSNIHTIGFVGLIGAQLGSALFLTGVALAASPLILAIPFSLAVIGIALVIAASTLLSDGRDLLRRSNLSNPLRYNTRDNVDDPTAKYSLLTGSTNRWATHEYAARCLEDRNIRPFDKLGFFSNPERKIPYESLAFAPQPETETLAPASS